MHQKPFVGRALPGHAMKLTALPRSSNWIGKEHTERAMEGGKSSKRRRAEKEEEMGRKGSEKKGREEEARNGQVKRRERREGDGRTNL